MVSKAASEVKFGFGDYVFEATMATVQLHLEFREFSQDLKLF